MVTEAIHMANDTSSGLKDCSVFSIIPGWAPSACSFPPEAAFEMLLFCKTTKQPEYTKIKDTYQGVNVLAAHENISAAKLAEIRALVAPVFGMNDTGMMLRNLRDAGHLLTPDSLSRILHLHCRRSISANVIYEGETGCGKSQNLKLYAHLINANASLFTNLKLHLLSIAKVATQHIMANEKIEVGEEFTAEEIEAYKEAATTITSTLSVNCTVDELIQMIVVWIRLGERKIANKFGLIVCAYFVLLFRTYPLYGEGLNPILANIINRFSHWVSSSPQISSIMKQLTATAADATFLIAEGRIQTLSDAETWPVSASSDELNDSSDCMNECEDESHEAHENNTAEDIQLFVDENELEDFLQHLMACKPVSLYHRKLADEGLTPEKWRRFITEVVVSAERIKKLNDLAVVCVFIDESNTAGAFGMVTEAFVSHSMDGVPLPANIFFVGAINPYRNNSHADSPAMDFTSSNIRQQGVITEQKEDESQDYLANVPYIVKPLPLNMQSLVLHYPNLDRYAENLFMREYFYLHISFPPPPGFDKAYWHELLEVESYSSTAINMILTAQELVRSYDIPRVYMSIRNFIRVTQLLVWMLRFQVPSEVSPTGEGSKFVNIFLPKPNGVDADYFSQTTYLLKKILVEKQKSLMRNALIMAISVTYMFQLPTEGHVTAGKAREDYRKRFINEIVRAWNPVQTNNDVIRRNFGWGEEANKIISYAELLEHRIMEWNQVLRESLEHLWSYAHHTKGLAKTNAIMETLYANILAVENKMGMLVTGPPGCGKTLSFNLACENLRGPCLNHSIPFQNLKKATKFMYQCSATSSGPEIASRFADAYTQQTDLEIRQPGKHICIVGVDEAGLTPENRQALKSLHDYLGKYRFYLYFRKPAINQYMS
jgi:hypothetical protein